MSGCIITSVQRWSDLISPQVASQWLLSDERLSASKRWLFGLYVDYWGRLLEACGPSDGRLLVDTLYRTRYLSGQRYLKRPPLAQPDTVTLVDGYYQFRPHEIYINFANSRLGGGVFTRGFVQEEMITAQTSFLLRLRQLKDEARADPDKRSGLCISDSYSGGSGPRDPIVIDTLVFLDLDLRLYGSGLSKHCGGAGQALVTALEPPVRILFVAMPAPNLRPSPATPGDPTSSQVSEVPETGAHQPDAVRSGRLRNSLSTGLRSLRRVFSLRPHGPSVEPERILTPHQWVPEMVDRAFSSFVGAYAVFRHQKQAGEVPSYQPFVVNTGLWGCGAFGHRASTAVNAQLIAWEMFLHYRRDHWDCLGEASPSLNFHSADRHQEVCQFFNDRSIRASAPLEVALRQMLTSADQAA